MSEHLAVEAAAIALQDYDRESRLLDPLGYLVGTAAADTRREQATAALNAALPPLTDGLAEVIRRNHQSRCPDGCALANSEFHEFAAAITEELTRRIGV